MDNIYFEFRFKCNQLILGERIKKGTFRPCLPDYILQNGEKIVPLPFSTIANALKHHLGFSKKIFAVGYLERYKRNIFDFVSLDTALNTAKIPLQTEFFSDVSGTFYVKKTSDIETEKDILNIKGLRLGGMKSKGFGRCSLNFEKIIKPENVLIGKLKVRLYQDTLGEFGIDEVIVPEIGYLFKPDEKDWTKGKYIKSIFEDSIVSNASHFLVDDISKNWKEDINER
ncbi:MAG: hypothetical protein ISS28_05800 [Candidatus Cloacimonetes bacterium]|nr:hypothetical protein [Candidatus Cloacimonadota bacterium]